MLGGVGERPRAPRRGHASRTTTSASRSRASPPPSASSVSTGSDRADAAPRARPVACGSGSSRSEPLDRARARGARRRRGDVLGDEPVAGPVRGRPAALDPPLALGPQLQEEARVDPKTGLFNARHFAAALNEELGRAERFERPMSLIMADLDLLREINNTYGHLAGDAVLKGIADVFRAAAAALRRAGAVRRRGVQHPASGDERRSRRSRSPSESAAPSPTARFDVETSSEPIRATVSIGVAALPPGRRGPERAHPPGRPRRLPRQAPGAKPRPRRELGAVAHAREAEGRLVAVPEDGDHSCRCRAAVEACRSPRRATRGHTRCTVRASYRSRARLALFVALVSAVGVAAGLLGALFGTARTRSACSRSSRSSARGRRSRSRSTTARSRSAPWRACRRRAVRAACRARDRGHDRGRRVERPAAGHPLRALQHRVRSRSPVARRGSGLRGRLRRRPRRARQRRRRASPPAPPTSSSTWACSRRVAIEGHERWWAVFQERFAWLAPHYLVYGFIGGVIRVGYERRRPVGACRLRGAAAADAQDAGGVPLAHAAGARRSCARRPRRSRPRTSRSSTQTGC